MKTYILIPLALLSFAAVALTEKKPYFLATILFYNDGKGHQLVAAGLVHKRIDTLIRRDIKKRLGNTTAKVVSLFNNIYEAPGASEVIGLMKDKFANPYIMKIPHRLATKVVQEKSKIVGNPLADKLEDLAKVMRKNEEAVETNAIAQGNLNEKDILSGKNIAPLLKPYYSPNTIFYRVETKCKTPTDYSCNLRKRHRHRHDNDAMIDIYVSRRFKRTKPMYAGVLPVIPRNP